MRPTLAAAFAVLCCGCVPDPTPEARREPPTWREIAAGGRPAGYWREGRVRLDAVAADGLSATGGGVTFRFHRPQAALFPGRDAVVAGIVTSGGEVEVTAVR